MNNEPNGTNGASTQDPLGSPNPNGPSQMPPADVETQQSVDLDKLEKENSQLDNYINSNGGPDKVKNFISSIEEKRALVNQHKQAKTDNSSLVWNERVSNVNNTLAPETTQATQNEPPVATQTPPVNTAQEVIIQRENVRTLAALANNNPYINKEDIQSGEFIKQAHANGVSVIDQNGLLREDVLNNYAKLVNDSNKSKVSPMPSSGANLGITQVQYDAIPEGKMDMKTAMAVIKASDANIKAGKSAHPDAARAIKVMRTGKPL